MWDIEKQQRLGQVNADVDIDEFNA